MHLKSMLNLNEILIMLSFIISRILFAHNLQGQSELIVYIFVPLQHRSSDISDGAHLFHMLFCNFAFIMLDGDTCVFPPPQQCFSPSLPQQLICSIHLSSFSTSTQPPFICLFSHFLSLSLFYPPPCSFTGLHLSPLEMHMY